MPAARPPKSPQDPAVIMITSPLEAEHVAAIAAVDSARIRNHSPARSPAAVALTLCDHTGLEGWRWSAAGEAEWRWLLAQADVLWDFHIPPAGETELGRSGRAARTLPGCAGRRAAPTLAKARLGTDDLGRGRPNGAGSWASISPIRS